MFTAIMFLFPNLQMTKYCIQLTLYRRQVKDFATVLIFIKKVAE